MEFYRTLSVGMSGEDVKHVKDALLRLGLLHASTHSTFGNDTKAAVESFQKAMSVTGIVDQMVWTAIETAAAAVPDKPVGDGSIPSNIGEDAATAIGVALAGVSVTRKGIALDALQFAFDPSVPQEYPLSFYIRGGNLYDKDLSLHVMTAARMESYFKKTSYAQFFDNGRKEMMLDACVSRGYVISGADCSGGVVGLLRHARVTSSGFDLSANGFNASGSYTHIDRGELQPADILHKDGHVGMFVGGDYAVEWMGGAYGCQLTKLSGRKGYSFVTKRTGNMGAWQNFLRPRFY
ncbi:MAG: peptidoglycan-binding domain-containing protein [Clostridia bacterium]